MYYIDIKNFGIIPYSLSKNGVIICGNLRGLRENKTPAELAEKRRKDITRFKGIILKLIIKIILYFRKSVFLHSNYEQDNKRTV